MFFLTHETKGEFGVTTDSVIDNNVVSLVLADHESVFSVKREFKVMLKDDSDGDRFTELMGALSGSGGLWMS